VNSFIIGDVWRAILSGELANAEIEVWNKEKRKKGNKEQGTRNKEK